MGTADSSIVAMVQPARARGLELAARGAGRTLTFASGVEELVTRCAELSPELTLLDAPTCNGESLADIVRHLQGSGDRRVGLIVSEATSDQVSLADRAGVDLLLLWPITPADLGRISGPEEPDGPFERDGVSMPSEVVGSSPAMRQVWRQVLRVAVSPASVVISGETGAGKEVVARAIHRFSARRAGPLVALNCTAVPENLLESEIFGHEKGAFTGASATRRGRFELADGGSLFLDEIGDLPPPLQVKLLRVLQERSFERVGGSETVEVDVRVIAATHQDLPELVRRGRFRADLYYRLDVLSVAVPPLRERGRDALELWDAFLTQGALRQGRALPETSPDVLRILMRYDWPGNVRELHNVVQHALTVCAGDMVEGAHLPDGLTALARPRATRRGLAGLTMQEIERAAILENYEAFGTVRETARALEISPRKVQYRLKEYREAGFLREGDAVAVVEAGNTSLESPSRPSPARVILAEDDDELRWALGDLLTSDGLAVTALPNGRAVLEHFEAAGGAETTDLVISDVRMPGLTGLQLLEAMREGGHHTPVILISAFGDDKTRAAAARLGAAALLDKPLSVDALKRAITGVLDGRRTDP